jgi:hypothetical protein
MDDIKELADILKRSHGDESSLTIKWAVVISIVVLICGFLLVGYITNAGNISKLQSKSEYIDEKISKVIQQQESLIATTQLIREDQIRIQMRGNH